MYRRSALHAGHVTSVAVLKPASRIQPAQLTRMQNPLASHNEGGSAQADLVVLRHLPHPREGFLHDAHQPRVDFVFAPEEAGEILHPLKVAHG